MVSDAFSEDLFLQETKMKGELQKDKRLLFFLLKVKKSRFSF